MPPSANGASSHQKQPSPKSAPPASTPVKSHVNGVDVRERAFDDFFKLLQEVSTKVDTKSIRSLIKEIHDLRQQVEKQKAAKEVIQDDLAEVKQNLKAKTDEVEELLNSRQSSVDESKKLKEQLEASKKEIAKLNENYEAQGLRLKERETAQNTAEAERDRAKEDLQQSETNRILIGKELKTANAQKEKLEALTTFGTKLKPVEGCQAELSASLGRLFQKATTLLEGLVFKTPLELGSDPNPAWDSFKSLNVVKGTNIPLPRSDTLTARQMRFTAALKIFAHFLNEFIFQPVYLTESNTWVERSLGIMSKRYEAQETHLRSMLLAFDPKQQQSMGEKRVTHAVTEAAGVLQHFVPTIGSKGLVGRIQPIFQDARAMWVQVQRVSDRIVPDFIVEHHGEWEVLRLPESPQNSEPSQNGPEAETRIQRQNSSGALRLEARVEALSVWPTFGSPDLLLCPGYAITGSQLSKARKELKEEIEHDEKVKKERDEAQRKDDEERCNATRIVPRGSRRRESQA